MPKKIIFCNLSIPYLCSVILGKFYKLQFSEFQLNRFFKNAPLSKRGMNFSQNFFKSYNSLTLIMCSKMWMAFYYLNVCKFVLVLPETWTKIWGFPHKWGIKFCQKIFKICCHLILSLHCDIYVKINGSLFKNWSPIFFQKFSPPQRV